MSVMALPLADEREDLMSFEHRTEWNAGVKSRRLWPAPAAVSSLRRTEFGGK